MSRYQHPYAQHCEPDGSCGCCEPLDLEESGSFFMPESAQEVDCGDTDL